MKPFIPKFSSPRLTAPAVKRFRQQIYQFYQDHGRQMPWRQTSNPYHILVSEIMLQQTQVERVLAKYKSFIQAFPDVASLAQAPLLEVIVRWQGLGYNRRALALQRIAQRLMEGFHGNLPTSVEVLRTLPGIGAATAGALVAFAFNQPVVFIETNIRRVFLYCFFQNQTDVRDSDILPLVEKTLDHNQPRPWYYALMDYGSMLKRTAPNPNRRSAHYQRQSSFSDSDRQIRGLILKTMLKAPSITVDDVVRGVGKGPERTLSLIATLIQEGFLEQTGTLLKIASAAPGVAP